MPGLRVATASGNWSNTATWEGGLLPGPEDIVCANGFTVIVDQNINVGRITTAAVGTIPATPAMTSDTTPGGTVIYSSDQPNNRAFSAFDRSEGISPGWYSNNQTSGFLGYIFPSATIIDRYRLILRGDGYDPRDWTFQASNDGVTWVTLHTISSYAGGSYTSPILGNTTVYTHYRINVTAARVHNQIIILEFYLLQKDYTSISGANGGGFSISGSYNLTLTNTVAIEAGTTNCLTYSGASPTIININCGTNEIRRSATTNSTSAIVFNNTGTLNIIGNITDWTNQGTSRLGIDMSAAGTLNFTGDVYGGRGSSDNRGISAGSSVSKTINIIGNVYGNLGSGNNGHGIVFSLGTLNITGNITGGNSTSSPSNGIAVTGTTTTTNCIINITGNILGGNQLQPTSVIGNHAVVVGTNPVTLYITGNVNAGFGTVGLSCNNNSYINQVGMIAGSINAISISSTAASAVNIFTGPFVSGLYGHVPFLVSRMHLKPTANSYFEFRDNSTNGALSPGAIASASYLYSPSTVVNGPSQNDVRFGTVYASGSQTGQMRVPLPSQVSLGIPVDNTTGSAVLTGADIANSVWNKLTSEITASNSIGVRLKNVSTPAITGAQLTALG